MPRGASPKREREYEELKEKFEKSGRYQGREEQVAARIVNKQRAQYGEAKREKQKDKQGQSPDRNLPIENYQHLRIDQITGRLGQLSHHQVEAIEAYEKQHKNRKTLIEQMEQCLQEK